MRFIKHDYSYNTSVSKLKKSLSLGLLSERRKSHRLQIFHKSVYNIALPIRPYYQLSMGGFHVTSSPPCWWTVNKRSLISSLCLSTSICAFHHCYLCLPRLHENHLLGKLEITRRIHLFNRLYIMITRSIVSSREL